MLKSVIGLVWFDLFVHPFSHICNNGHVNYRLQFITHNIWTSTQYNIINNNTKFKDKLEVEFVTTYRFMCIYINIPKSDTLDIHCTCKDADNFCFSGSPNYQTDFKS